MHEILTPLYWRYATKQFDPTKKITDEQLHIILDAMRLSPSSYGLQPWKFYVVTDDTIRTKLRSLAFNQSQITEASHIIVLASKKHIDNAYIEDYIDSVKQAQHKSDADVAEFMQMLTHTAGSKTPEEQMGWNAAQSYIALGFGLFAAAKLHIDSCPMEGFEKANVDKLLGIEEDGYMSRTILALGYRSKDDKAATREKVRFDLEDIVKKI